jgi:hypothetical protein
MNGFPFNMKPVKEYRKWELEEMLDKVAEMLGEKNELYEIDRYIKSHKHRVVRLPPEWIFEVSSG